MDTTQPPQESRHDDDQATEASRDQWPGTLPEATRDALRARLQTIYRTLDARVSALNPRCDLSGRCCRFQEFEHTLFLSEAEALILLVDAPPPVRPLDDGQTCPWQNDRGHCVARDARPLGCRVFFCDPAHQPHAADLTEEFLRELRQLTDDLGIPWNYAPLHRHLHQAMADGRFPRASDPGPGQFRATKRLN
ncbi:MAG: hypothetical protein AB7I30_13980 [Isosphaeraceae bacterium]